MAVGLMAAISAAFGERGVVGSIGDLADKFITTGDEKNAFMTSMEVILQKRDSEIESTIRTELKAKERVIVAELAQGDVFTKRARPTIVYFGLFVTFFNYSFLPLVSYVFALDMPPMNLPGEFWIAWGGAVSVYSLGRSSEKRGSPTRASNLITGNPAVKLLD